MTLHIQAFFESSSSTFSYVISDPTSRICSVIDSVLEFNPVLKKSSTQHVDQIIAYIKDHQLSLEWILETHVHADHLSAASYLKRRLGGKIGISKHIKEVYQNFSATYNLPEDALSHFDYFFDDDEDFKICGNLATALYVPGHTPADLAFKIGKHIFVGDTLFAHDVGTARCDFPGGDAKQLYESIQKILSCEPNAILYLCHDYPPSTRGIQYQTSITEQKAENIHIKEGIRMQDFILMRQNRDANLNLPRLIDIALQANLGGCTCI